MSYWILSDEALYPEYHAKVNGLLIDPNGTISASPFGSGKEFGEKEGPFLIKPDDLSVYGKYTDKLSVIIQGRECLFVVSELLCNFLSEKNINAEFFDVELMEDPPAFKYKIVNLLDVFNCVNEEESKLIFTDRSYSEIGEIHHLILDESKIRKESDMFLLGKVAVPVIIVKDILKKSIEERGFKGLKFFKIH